jgi:parallel beta-helix repeat protein
MFGSNSEDDVAALGKLASSSGVDINNNWVHDNADTALWADIGNTAFTIDHNTLGPNDRVGAFWEISCSMSITNNLIQGEGAFDAGHGLGAPGSGIRISSSNPNDNSCTSAGFQMLVSGNTLSGNHEGITLYDGHGPSVPVAGATVSGNQVTVTDTGSDAWQAYDANSNSFVGNTYRGNNNFNPGGNFAGWRSSGRDTTGSYTS